MTGVLKLNKLYVVSELDHPTVDIYNIEKELISKIEIQRDLAASSYIDITFSSDEREVTLEVLSSGNRSWEIFEIETGKLLYDKVSVPKEARVQYIDEYTLLVFVSPEGDVSNSEMTLKHSSFYSINLKTGEVELIKTVDEAYFCGESSEGVYLVGGDSRTIEFYSLPHQVPPLHRR